MCRPRRRFLQTDEAARYPASKARAIGVAPFRSLCESHQPIRYRQVQLALSDDCIPSKTVCHHVRRSPAGGITFTGVIK